MKNYEQYDYIHDTGLRASGGVSILIRKNIPQSKINISTPLQAVAISATLHKTTTICSIYIPPQDPINEEQLNNLINQLLSHIYWWEISIATTFCGEAGQRAKEVRPLKKSLITTTYVSTIESSNPPKLILRYILCYRSNTQRSSHLYRI